MQLMLKLYHYLQRL